MASLSAHTTDNGPTEAGSSTQTDTLAKYRTLFDSAVITKKVELDHWFGMTQALDYFRQMPKDELIEFTKELAHIIDVESISVAQEIFKLLGPRLLHLTDLIEENKATSLIPTQIQEVRALVARAYAFEGKFIRANTYILSGLMESEGNSKVVSQEDFDKSPFHQVLTSNVLSIYKYIGWRASMEYLFESSYMRWKQCEMGIDKFLIDKKLDTLLRWAAHPNIFRIFIDWSKTDFFIKNLNKFEEMLDFLLASLNGNGHYHAAKDFITQVHSIGKSISGNLVVETIRGLLSECNGTPDYLILNQITAIPEKTASTFSENVTKKESLPPSQAPPPSLYSNLSVSHTPVTRKKRSRWSFSTRQPRIKIQDNEPPKKRLRRDE